MPFTVANVLATKRSPRTLAFIGGSALLELHIVLRTIPCWATFDVSVIAVARATLLYRLAVWRLG